MFKRFIKKLLTYWPVFILLAVELILFTANYEHGTWLIGWDSTQPELNIKANIFRQLNAVWQEYRGLGLLDGMAHAANLVHTAYVYFLSLFFSPDLVRYVFVFLAHFTGGLGVYFLTKKLFKGKKTISLLASLFYLLNPATIQMFYAPFEAFVIHFAGLPWLIFVLINYLEESSKKNLFILLLANLLFVSQAHIPTLFIVYALSAAAFLIYYFVKKPTFYWKNIFTVIAVIFSINAFWGLPYVYSALNNASIITNSKINRLSNPEIVLLNQAYGDLKSTALFRGFTLDYKDWNKDQAEFRFQLEPWREHLFQNDVEYLTYAFFALAAIGLMVVLVKRDYKLFPVAFLFLFSFANLATETPGISYIKDWLEIIPFYKEAFRFTFTKFATLYALSGTLLMGYFLNLIIRKYSRAGFLVGIAMAAAVFYISTPAFKGDFLYNNLKLKVPGEYFDTFSFFDEDENKGRIALLPQPSFWGWEYLDWGYRGSGFIWQGVNNPVLHRAFDPWSVNNETYYSELKRVMELKDMEGFESLLNKYQIQWIMIDESIRQPDDWEENFSLNESLSLVEDSKRIKKVEEFGRVRIYQTDLDLGNEHVWAPDSYQLVNAELTYSQIDPIYSPDVAYVQDTKGISYPFVNLDKRSGVKALLQGDFLQILSPEKEHLKTFDVEEKIEETFGEDRGFTNATNCDLKKLGSVTKERLDNGVFYGAYDGGVSCDYFYYPSLRHDQGYVLRVKGENREGRGLKIYLFNPETKRMDLEELLPEGEFDEYFFILPREIETKGYTLNVETRSFGRISSENVIDSIEFVPFPYEDLVNIKLESENTKQYLSNLKIDNVKKYGTSYYEVETTGSGLFVLGQGFEKGWVAYSGKNKLEHKRVNNWQNGWFVPEGENKIIIIFWPQFLEWVGLVVLIFAIIYPIILL